MGLFTVALSESTIAEEYYFTVKDVERAFSPVTGRERAGEWARVWADTFASCMVGDRVVALPPGFGVHRLGGPERLCAPSDGVSLPRGLKQLYVARLLNFTPGTLTLLAAANPVVRKRFDRLKIRYGWATIDDPAQWKQMIDFLKNP
jgi:hypothetical protein